MHWYEIFLNWSILEYPPHDDDWENYSDPGRGTDGHDEIVFAERKSNPLPNHLPFTYLSCEEEVNVIQNPYYGLESENSTTTNIINFSRSSSLDNFHKIKVVDNIYYSE